MSKELLENHEEIAFLKRMKRMNRPVPLSKLQYETVRKVIESNPYMKRNGKGDLYSAAIETAAGIDKLLEACTYFSPLLMEKGRKLKIATELVVAAMEQWNEGRGKQRFKLIQNEVVVRDNRAPAAPIGGTITIGSHTRSFSLSRGTN